MHADVVAALNWTNGASRNKFIKRMLADNKISQRDRDDAARVVRIRAVMADAGSDMDRQDQALRGLKQEFKLSYKKLKRLCKMSKVCLANGRWYADLDERLADSTYRVPRKTIKDDHEILKFCMLHACRYSVG